MPLMDLFKQKQTKEGKILDSYVKNGWLKHERVNELYKKHKEGMTSAQVLNSLTKNDFVQSPEDRQLSMSEAKQNQGVIENKQLAETLMGGLTTRSNRDFNQQLQNVFPSVGFGGVPDFLAGPGPSPIPLNEPNNYLLNQLSQPEQNILSLYLRGIGDVNKAPELLPSLLKAPVQPEPAKPLSEEKAWKLEQDKLDREALFKLSTDQQTRARFNTGVLPPYPAPISEYQKQELDLQRQRLNLDKQELARKIKSDKQQLEKVISGMDSGQKGLPVSLTDKPIQYQRDVNNAIEPVYEAYISHRNLTGELLKNNKNLTQDEKNKTLQDIDDQFFKVDEPATREVIFERYKQAIKNKGSMFDPNQVLLGIPSQRQQQTNGLVPVGLRPVPSPLPSYVVPPPVSSGQGNNYNQKQQDIINRIRGIKNKGSMFDPNQVLLGIPSQRQQQTNGLVPVGLRPVPSPLPSYVVPPPVSSGQGNNYNQKQQDIINRIRGIKNRIRGIKK